MAQTNVQKIVSFLRAMRLREPPAKRVELRQVLVGNRDNRLRDWSLEGEDLDLDNIAIEADAMAAEDAEGHGSRQRYYIIAFETGEVQCGRSAVFAHQTSTLSEDIEDSEPATKSGLLSQLMRHNEQDKRTTMAAIGDMIRVQATTIDKQADQIDRLLTDRFESIIRFEQMFSDQHQRDLEQVREARKLDIQQQLFEQFKGLIPTVINKVMHKGVKIIPENMTPFEQQIIALMGTLKPEQAKAFVMGLEPMQQVMFLEAYEQASNMHAEAAKTALAKRDAEAKKEQQQEGGANGAS